MKNRILLMISGLCLVAAYWTSIPDEKTRMIVCDVGQGDGVVVMRGTIQLLIDVGPDNKKMVACLERYLPFWDKTVEAVIISHGDSDHNGGLESVKKSYRVENLYTNLSQNDVVWAGKIMFRVVSPDKLTGESNEISVVGVINNRVLMMGDAPAEVERKLVWRKIIDSKIDILKVSHHGSAEGTSEELVKAVGPKLAVISVGKRNKFGHPTTKVLERLAGVEIKRTDSDGDVLIDLE